jgi:hypothetical protein
LEEVGLEYELNKMAFRSCSAFSRNCAVRHVLSLR